MTKKRGQMRLEAVCACVSVQGLTLAFKMIKRGIMIYLPLLSTVIYK